MTPQQASQALQAVLDAKLPHTVADAAAKSGLSLANAERGLHQLVSRYRGHLRVTEEGLLVFVFPSGFTAPWETSDALARFARKVWNAVASAGRFVVRAWVAIVLVAYVFLFIAMLIGLAASRSEGRGDSRFGSAIPLLLRLIFDALFWTYHPFSPFSVQRTRPGAASAHSLLNRAAPAAEKPFYERVDHFFFGPRPEPEDPEAARRAVLAEIRAGKGRIGLADAMRVTGYPRERLDPLLSKLLVDYDGSVEVSEEGGIAYRFAELRKTAQDDFFVPRAKAVWQEREEPLPVTGNSFGENLIVGGLNAFNLVASGWVLATGMTFERLYAIWTGVPPLQLPAPGVSLTLGVIPFIFSLLLFALPLSRWLLGPLRRRRAGRENGRRAVLQAILESPREQGVNEDELRRRYRVAAGFDADPKELQKQVVRLGGDVDLNQAEQGIRYRFPDLELEARAVSAEREAASEEEAKLGEVVFTSEA